MHDRDVRDLLLTAQRDLQLVTARMADARRNLRHWNTRGYPTSSMGPGGHGHADPVGSIVAQGPDELARDQARAEHDLEQMRLALARLVRFVNRHTTLPNVKQADDGCRLCAGQGRYSTIYAQERCRWHYDFHRDWGEDAHPAITLRYLDGLRVTQQFIVGYHSTTTRVSP